jgi:trimeric autotransporter adhesin
LATTSTVHSTSLTTTVAGGSSSSRKQDSKDLIAFRTRSRTHSVERTPEENSSSAQQNNKKQRTARSHLISDSGEDDSQEEQESISKKNSLSTRLSRSSKSKKSTSSNSASKEIPTRQLRSSLNRKSTTVAKTSTSSLSEIPKKRKIYNSEVNQQQQSTIPNLGTRLAKNQSSREPTSSSSNINHLSDNSQLSSHQQTTGHSAPQNLLRRSSRGKSSTTTGSCVSIHYIHNNTKTFVHVLFT